MKVVLFLVSAMAAQQKMEFAVSSLLPSKLMLSCNDFPHLVVLLWITCFVVVIWSVLLLLQFMWKVSLEGIGSKFWSYCDMVIFDVCYPC